MINNDEELDVCGQCCPMPLIHISKSMNELDSGNTIKITGDDPIFEVGVRDYCELNQHEIVSVEAKQGRIVEIVVKK